MTAFLITFFIFWFAFWCLCKGFSGFLNNVSQKGTKNIYNIKDMKILNMSQSDMNNYSNKGRLND